jgi:hypothetical protein
MEKLAAHGASGVIKQQRVQITHSLLGGLLIRLGEVEERKREF